MTEENDEEWVIPVDYGDVLEGERETQLLYEAEEDNMTKKEFYQNQAELHSIQKIRQDDAAYNSYSDDETDGMDYSEFANYNAPLQFFGTVNDIEKPKVNSKQSGSTKANQPPVLSPEEFMKMYKQGKHKIKDTVTPTSTQSNPLVSYAEGETDLKTQKKTKRKRDVDTKQTQPTSTTSTPISDEVSSTKLSDAKISKNNSKKRKLPQTTSDSDKKPRKETDTE